MMKNFAAVAELLEPWIEGQMRYNSLYCQRFSFSFYHLKELILCMFQPPPLRLKKFGQKKEKCKGGEFCIFLD